MKVQKVFNSQWRDSQDTVCERATTADREQVALQPCACKEERATSERVLSRRPDKSQHTITVDVEQSRSLYQIHKVPKSAGATDRTETESRMGPHRLVPSADHGSHRQTHALVRVDEVREVLARRRDRDPLVIPELVQPALDPEVRLPVLAIGCRAGVTIVRWSEIA